MLSIKKKYSNNILNKCGGKVDIELKSSSEIKKDKFF